MGKIFGTVVFGGALAVLVLLAIFANKLPQGKMDGGGVAYAGEYKITGPFTHDNLSIFLIHGKSTDSADYITLEEGLKSGVVVVSEKGGGENAQVNELEIENKGVKPCYVQAGDIVKGGKQDRTLAVDFVVPPRSGKKPIQSFCVERGRWHTRVGGRGGGYAQFSLAGGDYSRLLSITSKELKLAAKKSANQNEVWEKVAEQQDNLEEALEDKGIIAEARKVKASDSSTSLALSLENKGVQQTADAYVNALSNYIADKDDVIGYCFAINGKMNSADIYGSNALFKKLWPKLLRSSAVEALSEYRKDAKFETPSNGYVGNWIKNMEPANAAKTEKNVAEKIKMITSETSENVLFDTVIDGKKRIHRNYIKK
ncbi:MAG: hypothetical protein A2W23_10355 [Planctomycetes bacterium RBG_16_43_13]|nr:MAG: hypothetical protein A2W23_10355 [Planctomycetes bacterium RBG_16_43_13]